MGSSTLSSREFNQDVGRAKRLAKKGPVFVTDRGRPSHVLLSIEAYQKLSSAKGSIIDMLAMPGAEDVEVEFPRRRDLPRPVDLS
jgi:hypothetical protein